LRPSLPRRRSDTSEPGPTCQAAVGRLTRRFPFEGVRVLAVSENPSPETQWPLMELDAL
jgi:hypothetical protein